MFYPAPSASIVSVYCAGQPFNLQHQRQLIFTPAKEEILKSFYMRYRFFDGHVEKPEHTASSYFYATEFSIRTALLRLEPTLYCELLTGFEVMSMFKALFFYVRCFCLAVFSTWNRELGVSM